MTDVFPCAVVREIRSWKNGKGADVILHDAQGEYYYNGSMDIKVGGHYDLEVVNGEKQGTYEIVGAKLAVLNPTAPPAPPFPPNVPAGQRMVSMDYNSFKSMMDSKASIDMSRFRALDAAVKVYDAMHTVNEDHVGAAHRVVEIARILEGYLI